MSAASGNDVTTGALSAMGAEASAEAVSVSVRMDKPSELLAEQKQTVSSIVSLAGIGVGATTGDVASAVNAGEMAKVAVEDNAIEDLYGTLQMLG
ncbi:VENN motif pre-toxin domain-containing protein [Faucicola mancuniensis]|uniref:VENN motif pre-toxin domain-containing protein n=1 Tax=Faucicola mancuniensis TaxID=1309795 RepID=UPI0039773957